MNTYLHGTTVLGALSQLDEENFVLTKRTDRRLITGILVGTAIFVPGLSLVWKAHRVVGGVLGLLTGPVVGGGIGWWLSLNDFKKIKANRTKRGLSVALSRSVKPTPDPPDLLVPW